MKKFKYPTESEIRKVLATESTKTLLAIFDVMRTPGLKDEATAAHQKTLYEAAADFLAKRGVLPRETLDRAIEAQVPLCRV